MAVTQGTRNIRLKPPGSLAEDKLLFRRMVFDETLARPFEGRMQMLSEDFDVRIEDVLGETLTIELDDASDNTRWFHAHVAAFAFTGEWRGLASYEATLRPWLWLLTRTSNCRIFQEKTAVEIVEQVFRDHGFSDFRKKLSGSYRTREYCVQYRETDFNFVSRLMEEEGIYYFFTHSASKHEMVLCDDYSSHSSESEVPYYPPDDRAARDKEYVWSWAVARGVRSGAYVQDDFDFTKPRTDLQSTASVRKEHAHDAFEIYDYPGLFFETGDGDKATRTRMEETQAEYSVVRADGCARRLHAGALFELADYPRRDQNAEYLLVSMSHHLEQDDYAPREGRGTLRVYRNTLAAVPSRTAYRPARLTPRPFVQGPQTATVVGKSGEEIWTDKYGRVKLQFHWDREGRNDENSSCWARVSQAWAGNRWGAMHIPRIGQEVVVDFLEGDPDRPLVTGRVYNADNMPPYGLPDNQTQSGIKSRSTKQGTAENFNELRFEDKKGEEEIYFHAEKDFTRIVENDDALEVGFVKKDPGDQAIEIYNDQTLEVGVGSGSGSQTSTIKKDRTATVQDGDDTLTVSKGNHVIRVSAGKTTHTAAQSIELKVGGSSIKIEPAKITIKSTQIDIIANAKTTVKGAMVDVNGSAMVTIKGGLVKIN